MDPIINMVFGGLAGLGLGTLLDVIVIPRILNRFYNSSAFISLDVDVNGPDVEIILPQSSSGARLGISDTTQYLKKSKLPFDIDYTKGKNNYKFVIHCDNEKTAKLLFKVLKRNKSTAFKKNTDFSRFCVGIDGKITFLANKKESILITKFAMREGTRYLSIAEDLLVPLSQIADDAGLDEEFQEEAYGFCEVIEDSDNLRKEQFENIIYLVDEFADKLASAGEQAYSDMIKDVIENYK